MTNREILYYFEDAKKYWELPRWKRYLFRGVYIDIRLCYYLLHTHIPITNRTTIGSYHFNTQKEIINGINMAIQELKQQDK